jgi:hypothetical protein
MTPVHPLEYPVIERLDPDLDPEGDPLGEILPVPDHILRQAVGSCADHKTGNGGVAEGFLPVGSEGWKGSIG